MHALICHVGIGVFKGRVEEAGNIQTSQCKHKAKRNPFLELKIKPFQLTDRK